uniref:synaptojanin-2-binding protein-like isoform X1 n=1 Tax=Centroberyx gerrardi TaxID=166262 RepID=UPI003AAAE7A0
MNGSLHSAAKVMDIKLKRGPAGLGFNIVGGVDQQYVMNDSGIYVSKIKEDGAAGLDGRLKEGDKILAINGVKLEDRTHSAAVELFRTAGEDVELRVQQKLLIVGGSFGLREFTQIRYDAQKIRRKLDPSLEAKVSIQRQPVMLEEEYEKMKETNLDEWKNIRGPRPWEDSKEYQEQQRSRQNKEG